MKSGNARQLYFFLLGVLILSLFVQCNKGADPAPIPMPPASPSGLIVTVISATQIDLRWTDNADNENGFKIERKIEGGLFSEIAAVSGNVTTYADMNIAKNTTYVYRVNAFNTIGTSRNYTNEVTVQSIDEAPSSASNLKSTLVSFDRIRIEWNDVATNESNYVVMRKNGNSDSIQYVLPANTTLFLDTALSESTVFTYKVFPKNNYGSAEPITITVTTLPNVETGLVAYYLFHANAQDSSGYAHHGTVRGATLTTDRFGKKDEALFFNTDSIQYMSVDPSAALNECGSITLSMWVKLSSYYRQGQVGFNHFINKSDQLDTHQFILASNQQGLYFYYGSGDSYFQSQTLPALNEWHHIAVTYSYQTGGESYCNFYLDGKFAERFPVTKPLPVTSFPLKFGSFADFGNSTLDGKLDDIRIYNRPLSAAAIAYLQNH